MPIELSLIFTSLDPPKFNVLVCDTFWPLTDFQVYGSNRVKPNFCPHWTPPDSKYWSVTHFGPSQTSRILVPNEFSPVSASLDLPRPKALVCYSSQFVWTLPSEHEGLWNEALWVMIGNGADSEMTQRCTGQIKIAPSKWWDILLKWKSRDWGKARRQTVPLKWEATWGRNEKARGDTQTISLKREASWRCNEKARGDRQTISLKSEASWRCNEKARWEDRQHHLSERHLVGVVRRWEEILLVYKASYTSSVWLLVRNS